MDLEGKKSRENLQQALIGESLARNKYTFYAMAARKEGLDEVADALERMAKNEMMHARFWFQQLYGPCGDTVKNLREAAAGEFSEWHGMYPEFARQAREEGLEELASLFERVAAIEKDHEHQFMKLLSGLGRTQPAPGAEEEPAFELRQGYRCQFCGAVYSEQPAACGTCGAVGAFEPCTYRR